MDPVQKAIWFVESHSRQSISLDEIAKACHVSPYHLTRAFAATCGLSLMRYLRGRRLSEAACQLAAGADDILNVALQAGYGSHEAFTRAFREQFAITPELLRTRGTVDGLKLVEALRMETTETAISLEPRFETLGQRTMAGIVERYSCEMPNGIPDQWQRFGQYLGHIPGQAEKVAYGICYNFDAESNFDYMCAVEVNQTANLPAEFKTLELPTQKYAVFHHPGHIAGIRTLLAAIWGKWFPTSGFQAAEVPTIERYGEEFNARTGMGGFEIWIAIG